MYVYTVFIVNMVQIYTIILYTIYRANILYNILITATT